ncbi:coiled-coil domain-containing protein 80 [Brienomyrus brachyistius]|uniref:coiled-coil domain-containing protein 80 n=1 Tax=Brienomyrus brachyistius TaxID=42636 RepID=UPI0020B2F105|nr:coiled-coil domain-containing protein 80 [Brienomyrus brachyistius]
MKRTLVLSLCLLCCALCRLADASQPANGRTHHRRLRFSTSRLNNTRSRSLALRSDAPSMSVSSSLENRKKLNQMQADERSAQPGRRQPGRNQPSPGPFAMVQDDGVRTRQTRMPSGAGSPNLLASFAGKSRLLVISAPHESDGYYRLMMSLLKPDVYCELAERHVHQIVMFHQEGEMGGKVRRITNEGKILEEPLDTALIPRLMNFLKLEKGKFGMVLLRKTLQVEERYPYPVRLEAMYEVIDQTPMRKFEKVRQKGFVQKCRAAGVEGQVVEGAGMGASSVDPQPKTPVGKRLQKEWKPIKKPVPPSSAPTTTSTKPPKTTPATTTITTTTSTTTTSTTTTTTKPTTTTVRPLRSTTTTLPPTTQKPTKALTTPYWMLRPTTTTEYYNPPTRDHHRGNNHPKATPYPTSNLGYFTKAPPGRYGDNRTDKDNRSPKETAIEPIDHKPNKRKSKEKEMSSKYDGKFNAGRSTADNPEEAEAVPSKKGKGRHDRMEKRKKKEEKGHRAGKRDKSEKRIKSGKEGKGQNQDRKFGKKAARTQDKDDFQKPSKKTVPPKGTLSHFLDYFESTRRLIVITTPHDEHKMYTQQRDEYLENVCEMAVRRVSIITIFGTLTNSTMKIDHYQLEHDRPMKGLAQDDLVNQDLIIDLRKEFGMTHDGFFMVLTDFDMKVKQFYQAPISMKAVLDYIDSFTSRVKEMEQQKREGVTCKKEDKPRSLENFLSRFRWRRRLFVISAPNDEEWAYQQQLYALNSQACNLGLRHVSILKLLGVDPLDMGGVLELYPINGSATVEREGLSASLVKDIRNYFQISPEYFSMLLVGKDGNVKSWYPSPMWSMAIIYDLIDSMQLRRQEMAIQQSLGMRCPEDEYGGYGYHQHGYQYGYQQGYQEGY